MKKMSLVDFLSTSGNLNEIILIDSENIDSDLVYSENFGDKLSNFDSIFFEYNDLQKDLFDLDGLMAFFSQVRSNKIIEPENVTIVATYTDKNDDKLIEDLYENLNLWNISFFVKPSENVNIFDYEEFLQTTLKLLLDEDNSIYINPIYSFVQYIFNSTFANTFLVSESEIEKLTKPTPPLDIKELFIDIVGEIVANNIKDKFLNDVSDDDINNIKNKCNDYINLLNNTLRNNKDKLNIECNIS